jgi:tetratricopeptide (TPR) repeat protein
MKKRHRGSRKPKDSEVKVSIRDQPAKRLLREKRFDFSSIQDRENGPRSEPHQGSPLPESSGDGSPAPKFVFERGVFNLDLWMPRSVAARDAQPRKARLLSFSVLIIATLLGVMASFGGAGMLRRVWKNWRTEVKVAEAEAFFRDGHFATGFVVANKAYLACPSNEAAIRCMAHRCEQAAVPEALFFFDRLEALGKLTPEDEVFHVSALIRAKRMKEAQSVASSLIQAGHSTSTLLGLGCLLEDEGYNMPRRMGETAMFQLTQKDEAKGNLALASLWIESDNAERAAAAQTCLWQIAQSTDCHTAGKAASLLHKHLRPGDARSTYLAWLLVELPDPSVSQRLEALNRLLGAFPEQADAMLMNVVQQWRPAPLEERLLLGQLIANRARPRLLAGFFTTKETVSHPLAAQLHVSALMAEGKIEDCMALIQNRALPVSRAQRSYAETLISIRNRCEPEEARYKLVCTLGAAAAESRAELLTGVAELALECKLPHVAAQAYEECLSIHGSENVAIDGLITVHDGTGQTEKLLATLHRALSLWPANERYQELAVYVHLLLGSQIERSLGIAETLLANRPEDDMRRFLVTLAHARLGDAVGVQAELARIIQKGGIPPRFRAVIGGMLMSCGESRHAVQLVSNIRESDLTLPQERDFLSLAKPLEGVALEIKGER